MAACWNTSLQTSVTNSAVTIKSSEGKFGGYYIYNPNSSVAYIQLFDTSGTITVGTTTPKMSFGIPATAGAHIEFKRGIVHANSIKVAATTTATGSTAPSSALDCNFLYT